MRKNRFFVYQKLGGKKIVLISHAPLTNQLKNVFRLGNGDEVILFDNSGFDFNAVIEEYKSNDSVSFKIIESKENTILPKREIYLFASIVKKDKFEWISEKATELGVSHIIPIFSERSEKKDLNKERIQKIIIEAAEQSGRGTLPILYDIIDLNSALSNYKHIKSIAWDPNSTKFVSQDISNAIGAYIGPEGGWSQKEIDLFRKYEIPIRSLGPQILKSETAVIAVISQLVF